ncbi:MAG: enterotoxin [Terracidiphilus sp.]
MACRHPKRTGLIAVASLLGFVCASIVSWCQAPRAGRAHATQNGDVLRLENGAIHVEIRVAENTLSNLTVTDTQQSVTLPIAQPFSILLKDGAIENAVTLRLGGQPALRELQAQPDASRAAERIHGAQIDLPLENADHSLRATWSLVLRDDSAYLRQLLTIAAEGRDVPISRVQLIDLRLPGAHVVGSVTGSPIVAGNLFLGFEHPLSRSKVTGDRATAWIERELPLQAGQSITYSSVLGVARPGQMRRDFLAYIEQERAHPYRTFLHYNSWYDLGYFNPYDQAGALDRVHAFGRELTEKRGVKLDSFLFDDGWDNHNSLWEFNAGFPQGFTPIREAAAQYHASPGIWMSPWGGYSKPKQERIAFGKQAGYEIVDGGYALSGPKYYAAFRDVCLQMIQKYGVNQFKFDGTGNADSVFPGSQFDSDFSAAIHLIGELRAAKSDIFINLTTGTWPSPFWLRYADSIWRGGDDDSTTGVGPYRERWITYRDAQTYERVVQNGPLYPLNSLMLHGMIYAQHHKELNKDPENDFRNEIRSYFGTGTQLQEMYITPSLLSEANWNDLAEAAQWSRTNADVLKDTHWVGGDPAWLEVYGWASWTPRKGILVLRNPSDKEQSITVRLQDAFELPPEAAAAYTAHSPWKDDARQPALALQASQAYAFRLAPFQVLTLDVMPVQEGRP